MAKIHTLLTLTDLCHRTLIQPICRLGNALFPVTDEHFFRLTRKELIENIRKQTLKTPVSR